MQNSTLNFNYHANYLHYIELFVVYVVVCNIFPLFCMQMNIWAIPRKVTYAGHKKRQLVGQSIKEGEQLNNENK